MLKNIGCLQTTKVPFLVQHNFNAQYFRSQFKFLIFVFCPFLYVFATSYIANYKEFYNFFRDPVASQRIPKLEIEKLKLNCWNLKLKPELRNSMNEWNKVQNSSSKNKLEIFIHLCSARSIQILGRSPIFIQIVVSGNSLDRLIFLL